ncbi:MAG TPA: hypothetical protein DDW42_00985 [Desulfobacteraceae bacterium]|nr:hypothetical protein [Desulfobacteraceae bacterium]
MGSNFLDLIPLFDKDPGTEAIVIFSEPGGVIEEKLSELVISKQIKTPIIAFVAGRFVDKMPGVRFGHAATIVEGKKGTAAGKIEQFKKAGIHVAEGLDDIVSILKTLL